MPECLPDYVSSDILTHLTTTRSLHSSYTRIRALSSSSSPELAQARAELSTSLQDLTTDLQDLVDSVKAVEGDPFRYGLDVTEVSRRRELVKQVGNEVAGMREELSQASAVGMKGKTGGESGLPPPTAFNDEEGGNYEAFEQERQVEIMAEQDEALDGVFQTVGTLRAQADDMGRELEEQAGLIGEVEGVADRVGGKLQGGIKQVGRVIRDNEGTHGYLLPLWVGLDGGRSWGKAW